MNEPLRLNEAELGAMADVAMGKASASDPGGAFASLLQRGLATVEGETLTFSDEMRAAFDPLASWRISLAVLNAEGNVVDQFFLGRDGAAHALPDPEGLSILRLTKDELPGAFAARLQGILDAAPPSPIPDAEQFATVGEALGVDGLVPVCWGGLVISRRGAEPAGGDAEPASEDEWVMVVRCESGVVWQAGQRGLVAYCETLDDLTEQVKQALGG